MNKDYKIRLERLGIQGDNPNAIIMEDLLNLVEFLYEESEKSEIVKFRENINRVLKPTN